VSEGVNCVFPREFAELLNDRGRAVLAGDVADFRDAFAARPFHPVILDDVLDADRVVDAMSVLGEVVEPHLALAERRLPDPDPAALLEAARPRRVRQALAHPLDTGPVTEAVSGIGLLQMMLSETLVRFAEAVTGDRLCRYNRLFPHGDPGMEILCYGPGDQVALHSDRWFDPRDPRTDGYVEVHLMSANSAVAHQWLVWETGGVLSELASLAQAAAVAVHRLPFWHYTTPLVAVDGREADARRWLISRGLLRAGA
jgi:hypothetical protein